MKFKTLNELSTSLFIEELTRQGITDAFIAPGSRSTPLVLACENNPKIKIHTHFDERGLGFLALGFAKKSKNPPIIITTSGTAVANLLPAVVEAHYSHTPFIIMSADRPFELINVGANQAITQKDIFSQFVIENFQIPPVSEKTPLESLLTIASHSVFKSKSLRQPIHINWMFQEPLAPLKSELDNYKLNPKLDKWLNSKNSYTSISISEKASDSDLKEFTQHKKILLIFGSLSQKTDNDSLLKIATHLNSPVFCDVQNILRFQEFPQSILRFDLLLDLNPIDPPDLILHIGGPLTSKRLNQYLENYEGEYVQIHDFQKRLDFMHLPKKILDISVKDFSNKVLDLKWDTDTQYLNILKNRSDKLDKNLKSEFKDLNEISLPYFLTANIKSSQIFVGSSMPIRDLERFAGTSPSNDFIFNRGASGIDGNIATAVGAALATNEKTICVLGDQAFLYDVNSLALVKNTKVFHTVVVNNQGGGIFSFLPVSQIDKKSFTKNFTHPHEWNLKASADMFHLKYSLVRTPEEFINALNSNESTLIEIKTDIDQNVKAHRDLTQKLKNHE